MFRKQFSTGDSDSEDDHPSKSPRLDKLLAGTKLNRITDVKTSQLAKKSSVSSSSSSDTETEITPAIIREKLKKCRAKLSFTLPKPETSRNLSKVRSDAIRAFRNATSSENSSAKSKTHSFDLNSSKIKPLIGKIPKKEKQPKLQPSALDLSGSSLLFESLDDQAETPHSNNEKFCNKPIQESYDDMVKTSRRSLGVLSSSDKEEYVDKSDKGISSRARMYLPSQVNNFQRFALRSNLGEGFPSPMDIFKSKYESVKESYFDTHCHPDFILRQLNYMGSFQSFMNSNIDSTPNNYKGCLAIFCDPKEFKSNPSSLWHETLKMSNVYGSVGCHPKKAKYFKPYHESILEHMLDHPKCKAIGEIGLDYSGSFSSEGDLQKRVLHKHLKLAVKKKKPIVIHAREADDDIIKELLKHDLRMHKMHRHCFTGDIQTMKNWLQIFPKSFVGFTPLVTYENSERCLKIRECVKEIPLNKLLIETDSPYFLPSEVPKNYFDNNASFPPMAITVAAEIASIRGITTNEVLFHCRRNTREMYGISY